MQDVELCEVVVNLGIIPGKPVPQAAVETAPAWEGLEEQEKISQTLVLDVQEILIERISNTCTEVIKPSDNERKLRNDNEGIGSTGVGGAAGRVRGVIRPPPYTQLSSLFGPLEHYAVSCGNVNAENHLCKTEMSFIEEHACRRSLQSDVRSSIQRRKRSLQYGTALSA